MDVAITAGAHRFTGQLEMELAPKTCVYFLSLLPYRQKIIHVRWSGEGCWIPLGETAVDLPVENATSYPAPGQFLFYPGGFSETEILLAYGSVRFASKLGQLAGNHFLSITGDLDRLRLLGRQTLWEGAQDILIEADGRA